MISIKLNIENEQQLEVAIRFMRELSLTNGSKASTPSAQEPQTVQEPAKKSKAKESAAKEIAAKEEPPAKPKQETPAEQPEAELSIEDVRLRLAEISTSGKAMQLRELLQSYGVTRLTELDPAKRPELLKKAEAL